MLRLSAYLVNGFKFQQSNALNFPKNSKGLPQPQPKNSSRSSRGERERKRQGSRKTHGKEDHEGQRWKELSLLPPSLSLSPRQVKTVA